MASVARSNAHRSSWIAAWWWAREISRLCPALTALWFMHSHVARSYSSSSGQDNAPRRRAVRPFICRNARDQGLRGSWTVTAKQRWFEPAIDYKIRSATSLHRVSKKVGHCYFCDNFRKSGPTFRIFSPLISERWVKET